MHTVGTAFLELRDSLLPLYDSGEARAIAHEVMEHLTGLGRLQRLSGKEQVLSEEQAEHFLRLKAKLLTGTPLQYALGFARFMNRSFRVSPAVLIPRPETEELVQWIIHETQAGQILDIGTGSGCIAISLKLALPPCRVTAIDVSMEALNVAIGNADSLGAKVSFQDTDFLKEAAWPGLGMFDIIVSNPPYIPVTERDTLHPNVRDHEPAGALFVPGDSALLFYKAIAKFGHAHLLPGGKIYCELHRDYAEETARLFDAYDYSNVTLRKDMQGAVRMLCANL